MAPTFLECLGCGARRSALASVHSRPETGECARCGYVGWAGSTELTEHTRRALRELPVELRRLRAAS
jgi:hypothetical protein